jgi:hypothetical protein
MRARRLVARGSATAGRGFMDADVERDGFAVVHGVLEAEQIRALREALGPATAAGRRGLLGVAAVAEFARSAKLVALVRPHLPVEPVPVRAIDFHKGPDANWLVAWHQDLTLAVRARVEAPGLGPWSVKDGIPHVQAPAELLAQMLTVRLHLDDADATNGALRVLPGTHRLGRLSPERIAELSERCGEVVCTAASGDVLLMRPLLLHASSRATSDRPRRVLHIEYAGFALPAGQEWHQAG